MTVRNPELLAARIGDLLDNDFFDEEMRRNASKNAIERFNYKIKIERYLEWHSFTKRKYEGQ